ncbi:MAG: hypothetical protein JXB49_20155 [Bacteroidales bacterium]|nr:hypothetical protein [Bacteroidales bacterium]
MMKYSFIFLYILIAPINVFCQEFLNDKVMKLTAMSEDKSYGITQEKSIKVGSIENEYKYINALTGPARADMLSVRRF